MPIHVELGKKKKRKYFLNLNIFRLQHGHVINNVKKEYHRIAEPLIPRYKYKYIRLTYELYLPDRRKRDISNLCSVIDKNFCDSLVKVGVIEDDNYEFLQDVHYKYGGYDKSGRGYVLITVEKVEKKDMKDIKDE
jgi:Holliday junction resolvase RusA-like endonuclease